MISIGSPAPDFTLPDQNGQSYKLSQWHKRANVVIFFYPKDNTAGCTKQACSFRDNYEGFSALNTQIIGISSDPPSSHQGFITAQRLPFSLLSDEGAKVSKLYNVPKTLGIFPGRATFVVDKEGIVRMSFSSQLDVQEHIDKALKEVQKIHQAG